MSVLSEVSPASWEAQKSGLEKEAEKKQGGVGSEKRDKKDEIGADRERLHIKGAFVHY